MNRHGSLMRSPRLRLRTSDREGKRPFGGQQPTTDHGRHAALPCGGRGVLIMTLFLCALILEVVLVVVFRHRLRAWLRKVAEETFPGCLLYPLMRAFMLYALILTLLFFRHVTSP
jgi:hypothetical protein